MTDQAWRIQACRAPLKMLAACLLLSGCAAQQGAESMTHVVPGDGSTHRCYLACSSGFHTTVWQNWQEGPMATRIGGVEMGTPPVQPGSDRAAPGQPPPGPPIPESIPIPKPEPPKPEPPRGEIPSPPAVLAPAGSDALPKPTSDSSLLQIPQPDKQPAAPDQQPAPLQQVPAATPTEKPAEKPPIPSPPSSSSAEPIIIAPEGEGSGFRFLGDEPAENGQICQGYPKRSRRRFSAAAR